MPEAGRGAAAGKLRAAYRAALYCVQAPAGELILRHGQRSAVHGRAFARLGVHHRWAVVTPCNPHSHALPAVANQQRLDRFYAELEAFGWRWYPSINRDPSGTWPDEAGALLCDVPHAQSVALAARHGQYAILTAPLAGRARLAWAIKPGAVKRAQASGR